MSTSIYIRTIPAQSPLEALQHKARRQGFPVLRARNFAAYRNTEADSLGHVIIYDSAGRLQAGPFGLAAADAWLAMTSLARAIGDVS